MTVYAQGSSVDTAGLGVVAPKDVAVGNEYIWEYGCPAVTFTFIDPSTMANFVTGLLDIDATIKKNFPGVGSPPITITGVTIDTENGNIWVRGRVNAVPVTDVQQAGVSPLAIAATIGLIFGIIGAAVTLRYVYDVTHGTGGTGALDPCKNPGVFNYIDCLAQESKWFLFGALFGVVALVVFLLVKFGPKAGTA